MKLFRDKVTFEVFTHLDSEELLERLKEFVEFEHKGKISTFFIDKEYYGKIIKPEYLEIWRKPLFSGFLDKGLAPVIKIYLDKGKVVTIVQDYFFILLLIICSVVILSSGILIVEGICNSNFREFIWFGLLMWVFPLIGLTIVRLKFFRTVKYIKERLQDFKK